MLKSVFTILLLPGSAALAAVPLCPIPIPAAVPYYDDLYGSSAVEIVGVVNARIQAEESNLRGALSELELQHKKVTRIWPGRVLSHVIRLEDAPSTRIAGRQTASRRTLSMFFDGPELTCVLLEYSARDLLDPFRWVQKTAWLDAKNLEMRVSVRGYLPSDTDQSPDRIADMAPHLRVEMLTRMTRYLREARYSVDMQMIHAQRTTDNQNDAVNR